MSGSCRLSNQLDASDSLRMPPSEDIPLSLVRRLSLAATLATGLAGAPLFAQATTKSQNDPRPIAQAAARQGSISIDGKLDEAGWTSATPISELTQSSPNEGKPPTEKTEIRILYDESAIYIGARMFDSQGKKGVKAVLTRRDQANYPFG